MRVRHVVVAVAALLVGRGSIPVAASPSPMPDVTVPTCAPASPTMSLEPLAPIETMGGSWHHLPPGRHPGGIGASITWTGQELVVWGGDGGRRGAAWDPRQDRWSRTAPAPIPARSGHVAAWTDSELIVWGGDQQQPRVDGAAYDPRHDRWRRLPDAPGPGRRNASAAWTGRELLIVGGAGADEPALGGIAYDPSADRWRTLAPSPLPPGDAGGRHAAVAAWTGTELVVVSYPPRTGALAEAAAYDPAHDTWRAIGTLPLAAIAEPDARWTGTEVLLVSAATGPTAAGRATSLAYDPAADCVRPTAYPSDTSGVLDAGSAWDGHWLWFAGRAYDPAADAWIALPAVPRGAAGRQSPAAVMAADTYVLWGGLAPGERMVPLADGVAFTPGFAWRHGMPAPVASDAFWGAFRQDLDTEGVGEHLDQVVDGSDLIVVGRPVGLRPDPTSTGGPGAGRYGVTSRYLLDIAVDEVLKGRPVMADDGTIQLLVAAPDGITPDEAIAVMPSSEPTLFLLLNQAAYEHRHGIAIEPGGRRRYFRINDQQSVLRDVDGVMRGIAPVPIPGSFPGGFEGRPFETLLAAIRRSAASH